MIDEDTFLNEEAFEYSEMLEMRKLKFLGRINKKYKYQEAESYFN